MGAERETPSTSPVYESRLSPMGTVHLAIKSADYANLATWPYDKFVIIVSRCRWDESFGDRVASRTMTKRDIGVICEGRDEEAAPVVSTLRLLPWVYQVRVEIIGEGDQTVGLLNNPSDSKIVVRVVTGVAVTASLAISPRPLASSADRIDSKTVSVK
ncbi:MAG: hypothetical protein HYY84_12255 [Deltaproteobacteria bacterium]|nr:hypothetical protein [Deltaproteobacteria bacterium]